MGDLIGALFDKVDSLGASTIQSLYTTLSQQLQPVFLIGMTIYVVFWGYEMIFGRSQAAPNIFLWRVVRIMLIYGMAFTWPDFQALVVNVFTQSANGIGAAVCSSVAGAAATACSATQSLTNVWNAGMSVASSVSQAGGTFGIALMMLAIVIVVFVALFVAASAAIVVLGKMALFLLLGLAPIFIAMALFDFSSRLFTGWITQAAQYAVLQILGYGFLGFYVTLMQTTAQDVASAVSTGSSGTGAVLTVIAPFLLMCGIGLILLFELMSIASGIAGGAPLRGAGFRPVGRGLARTAGWAIAGGIGGYNLARSYANSGPNTPTLSAGRNALSGGDPRAAQVSSALERTRT